MKDHLYLQSDLVTVVVSTLSLESESSIMQNPEIRKLFVEYHFLGLPPEETETPDALLKPRPYQSIAYHFSKSIVCRLSCCLLKQIYVVIFSDFTTLLVLSFLCVLIYLFFTKVSNSVYNIQPDL